MPSLVELVAGAALLTGTFLTCVACLGLVRFPDVYCRMHAAGKAGTLGVSLVIVAVGIIYAGIDNSVPLRAALAVLFQFMTSPAATHVLARAAYVTQYPLSERTALDELDGVLPSGPNDDRGRP